MKTPETPLPWQAGPLFHKEERALFYDDHSRSGRRTRRIDPDNSGAFRPGDAAYIEHAANAYPRLVAALSSCASFLANDESDQARALLCELGEEGEL